MPIEGMRPATDMPPSGALVNIKSVKGNRVYEKYTVIGLGDSLRGTALWLFAPGSEMGTDKQLHVYIPVLEVESWGHA